MFTTAPLFGKFHSPLHRTAQPLRRQLLHHLESLCADWIAPALLAPNAEKANSRERLYTPKLTFLSFLDQVLNPGSSCREAVRQIQAYYHSLPDPPSLDSDTSAYCQARSRWTVDELVDIRRHLAEHPGLGSLPFGLPANRPVKVIDGTCLNLADTPANRQLYPQSECQKPHCGFPLLRLLAIFSLKTGALFPTKPAKTPFTSNSGLPSRPTTSC